MTEEELELKPKKVEDGSFSVEIIPQAGLSDGVFDSNFVDTALQDAIINYNGDYMEYYDIDESEITD